MFVSIAQYSTSPNMFYVWVIPLSSWCTSLSPLYLTIAQWTLLYYLDTFRLTSFEAYASSLFSHTRIHPQSLSSTYHFPYLSLMATKLLLLLALLFTWKFSIWLKFCFHIALINFPKFWFYYNHSLAFVCWLCNMILRICFRLCC